MADQKTLYAETRGERAVPARIGPPSPRVLAAGIAVIAVFIIVLAVATALSDDPAPETTGGGSAVVITD